MYKTSWIWINVVYYLSFVIEVSVTTHYEEPDYDHIEFGGVLRFEDKHVGETDKEVVQAAKIAASFIRERFPWSVETYNDGNIKIGTISNIKLVHLIYSVDDRHPVFKESLDGNPQFIVFGAIYRFILTWKINQNLYIHNITLSKYPQNKYHIYSHTFHISNQNQTCRKYESISTELRYSKFDSHHAVFYFPSCLHSNSHIYQTASDIFIDQSKNSIENCDTQRQPKPIYSEETIDKIVQSEDEFTRKTRDCANQNVDVEVMTFNVWNMNSVSNKNKDYVKRVKYLGKTILKINPDIIGLQEVRYQHNKGGQLGPNQVKHIADMLPEYQFVYTPGQLQPNSLQDGRTEEGVAIFSKYPIINYHNILLFRNRSNSADLHQRICQHVEIHHPLLGMIHVLNTHLSLSHEAREKSVVQVWRYIQQLKGPVIFFGDLNAEPNEKAVRFLRGEISIDGERTNGLTDTWLYKHRNTKYGLTYNALEKSLSKRIDYIFIREYKYLKLTDILVYDDGLRGCHAASDHVPVVARFQVNIP